MNTKNHSGIPVNIDKRNVRSGALPLSTNKPAVSNSQRFYSTGFSVHQRQKFSTPPVQILLYFIFTFFLNSIYIAAFSQKEDLNLDHLDINSGLFQSNVICILQDSRGFMWFGTQDGLNKYDGYNFTVYKKDIKDSSTLSHNYIKDIIEDKNGDLWIATWGGGLNWYDRKKDKFRHFKHDPLHSNSISANFLVSLLKDSEDKIWISTAAAGVDVFEPKEEKFMHYKSDKSDKNSLSDAAVSNMIEDHQHNIWIGTVNGGLNVFNKKKNAFTRFTHDEKDTTSISSNNISSIFEDSRHNIWVGTNGGGLNLFNPTTGKFRVFKKNKTSNSICDNVIFSVIEDNDGLLWIASENGGMSKLDPGTGIFTNYRYSEYDSKGLSSSSLNRIYKDKKGDIWIGTYNAGINFLNRNMGKFTRYRHNVSGNSLSNNNVLSIYEDNKNNLWIGTDGGGINLFDRKTGKFTPFRHQEDNKNTICGNFVLSISQDSEENMWIGTWGDGLTVYNKKKNTYKQYKNDPDNPFSIIGNNIWAIFKDRGNNIWLGVQGKGLCLYDRAEDRFIQYTKENTNLSSNNILSLFEDREGMLWIGTDDGGLNQFNRKTNKITWFKQSDQKNSLSDNSVNSIIEDETGNLWIGTNDGLNYMDRKTNAFTTYTKKDGLPSDVIFGVLEDSKNSLWISTNKGISQLNQALKKFKNFDVTDGLQSNEFKQAYCKSRLGLLYFGGINGFNEFDPVSIKQKEFDPPLVITDFRIGNKKVPIAIDENDPSPLKKNITETREITISYKNSFVSFEFASLNYIPEEKKQYAYMLENFDKNWNEIGTNHSATYTNLDPGKYIFKVKGLNNEGKWSSRTLALTLTITPPFWVTWWFRTLLAISILAILLTIYRMRVHTIKKWGRQLELQVAERTHQLAYSIKEEQKARQEAESARYETDHANIDLERKNKEMEQFAYIASHDLQEPLRTTSSFARLLQKQYKGKLDEKADKYFTFILDASDRMKELIKNLLDYSRIGNNKELEKVDCDKILRHVFADLAIIIGETSANINNDPLPVINGYSTELQQLFQNLLTNAIKFRNKDISPEIFISVKKDQGYWHFAVKDNGIGIDEKHNEKIFVIFQRLHTRTEYEGTGIGLSHCKKIVELHKGKIWVESTAGLGSTFHFTIRQKIKSNVYEKAIVLSGKN